MRMAGYAVSRTCTLLAALVFPLCLTGCHTGLFGGRTAVSNQGAVRAQGTSGEAKPVLMPLSEKPSPLQQQTEGQAVGTPATGPGERITGALPAQEAAGAAPAPQPVPAGSTRQFAVGAPADVSYGDAVLTEDTTWHGEVRVAGAVTVASQATLTIEPGAVIRFGAEGESWNGSLLLVHGRIDVRGTPEKPVRFTSLFARPMAGDWRGIVLLGSEKRNLLESCVIEGAESGLDASYATVTLKNVLFSRCSRGAWYRDSVVSATGGGASGCIIGVRLSDSEADLRGGAVAGNRQGIVAERSSLYLAGGSFLHNDLESLQGADCRVKITGGEFIANGAGIDLESSQGSISGARIAENADYGIRLAASRVRVYGNEIVRNSGSGLKVTDGRGAAWGNAIFANGTYDLVNGGSEEFMAMGNWWGAPDPAVAGNRISPARGGDGGGRVLFLPLLKANPLPPK